MKEKVLAKWPHQTNANSQIVKINIGRKIDRHIAHTNTLTYIDRPRKTGHVIVDHVLKQQLEYIHIFCYYVFKNVITIIKSIEQWTSVTHTQTEQNRMKQENPKTEINLKHGINN